MKRSWYNLKAAAGNKPAALSIYDDIGAWGVSAAAFIADLKNLSGPLNLEISSLGGNVIEGVAIYNALKRYGQQPGNSVDIVVMGVAASIASVIVMAGTTVKMPANTYLMVHKPWGGLAGNADEMRELADHMDRFESSLVLAYTARTGKSEDDIKAMLKAETWLSAQEAVDQGFADEVLDAIDVSASCDVERLPDDVRAMFKPAAEDTPPADDPPAGDQPVEDADDSSVSAFAAEATALLTAAGLENHAARIVLASTTLDQVKARIGVATEIRALCAVAKHDAEADALIAANKSVVDARAHLIDMLAKDDETREIDSRPKNSDQPAHGAQPAAVTTADIWAARRNKGVTK
ncbi:MAG: Clp protease ClpP [Hydrogenophaga sp.]|nr:Clp protease ClpP [Hydrogenophaga sp.]